MKTGLNALGILLMMMVWGSRAYSHGCPVEPDQVLVYDLGAEAQIFWQYGPDLGDQSVAFVELKIPGTTTPANFITGLAVIMDGTEGKRITIAPALDEKGKTLPGEYRLSNLQFPYAGKWKFSIVLTTDQGVSESKSWVVEVCAGR